MTSRQSNQKQTILYGVAGEGMGHATRSQVIINYITTLGYNVILVASARAHDFLAAEFKNNNQVQTLETEGFHINYDDNKMVYGKTILENAKKIKKFPKNAKALLQLEKEPIGLVITDFDLVSYTHGKLNRLPIIAIDNIHMITHGDHKYTIPYGYYQDFEIIRSFVRLKMPRCSQYLIPTFFPVPIKKENTELTPPIIRKKILHTKPTTGNHFLVYQTSPSMKKTLLEVLPQFPKTTFHLYGLRESFTHANIISHEFNTDEFITLFASAKGVISNGGFSFISEAIHFKKPILSIPVKKQIEQILNAIYIDKFRYGRFAPELTTEVLNQFITELPLYNSILKKQKPDKNKTIFNRVETILTEYLGKPTK